MSRNTNKQIERHPRQITIMPCNGLGQVLSGVTRMAAYIVNEDLLPYQTSVLCTPALMRGVEEDILFAEKSPIIVIDGCKEKCGTAMLNSFSLKPIARLYVPDVIKETKLKPGKLRKKLSEEGQKLANEVANRVADVAKSILEEAEYKFTCQNVKLCNGCVFEYDRKPDEDYEFINLGSGWYRPKSMPPIPSIEGNGINSNVYKVTCISCGNAFTPWDEECSRTFEHENLCETCIGKKEGLSVEKLREKMKKLYEGKPCKGQFFPPENSSNLI